MRSPRLRLEETMMPKIPKTDSIQELAMFWQRHDVTDFEDELEEVPIAKGKAGNVKAGSAGSIGHDAVGCGRRPGVGLRHVRDRRRLARRRARGARRARALARSHRRLGGLSERLEDPADHGPRKSGRAAVDADGGHPSGGAG